MQDDVKMSESSPTNGNGSLRTFAQGCVFAGTYCIFDGDMLMKTVQKNKRSKLFNTIFEHYVNKNPLFAHLVEINSYYLMHIFASLIFWKWKHKLFSE